MDNLLLIDSDILIDFGNGIEEAANRLEQEEKNAKLTISAITQMELLVGCRNAREQQNLEKFLTPFELAHLNESISSKALELIQHYRLSHGLLIPDALIAATAISLKIPLLSKNQRDFRFIESLDLLSYP